MVSSIQNTHATNTDLHSLIIHKAAKLRDVDFINGEGDISCIIENTLV